MVKPIKPSEVKKKEIEIPDAVIEAVNEMIQEKWNGKEATIFQDDIIDRIIFINKTLNKTLLNRDTIFDKNYLDFEDIFRKAGWKVEYDKPGYNEDYKAYFVFSKKRKS